jgi:hypothetical protein
MEDFSVIGKGSKRVDAGAKATGEALYTADLSLPRMLVGKVLRSSLPHARILHVDAAAAEKLPGVRAVVTSADSTGEKWGVFRYTQDQAFLPADKVRFIVLGKGMANGYAISAVSGNDEVMMAAASKLFISSTFFPNSDGYVAALKTIEVLERENVIEKIWEKGNRFLKRIRGIVEKYGVGAELTGVAPMFYITFKRDEGATHRGRRDAFYAQLIRRSIFLHPHHHGYIAYRHTEEDLDRAACAIDEAMAYVDEKYHCNVFDR